MRNVMGFMAGLPGYGNQIDGETLVDQEPHDTGIAASRRRDRCTSVKSLRPSSDAVVHQFPD
jgi:hypothetical protein